MALCVTYYGYFALILIVMDDELMVANSLPVKSKKKKSDKQSTLSALALGLTVDVGGSVLATKLFVFSMILFGLVGSSFWTTVLIGWSFIIGLAGLFSGAFLAARYAPSRPMLHAGALLAIDLLISFAITAPGIATWLFLAYALCALPATYSGGTVAKWLRKPRKRKLLEQHHDEEPDLLT